MRRIAVLGGSTPFTAGLVQALPAGDLPPHVLVLLGRSADSLSVVARHARHRLRPLGWEVLASTDHRAGLEGADVVIHQVRYGNLAGRAADEALSLSVGVPPDETLGVAGLASALRLRLGLAETCELLVAACPGAWVLNLTNPLSVVVALMHDHGVRRCLGLCELPRVTAAGAARLLGAPLHDWSYVGLNHRGFVTSLVSEGRDVLPDLGEQMRETRIGGIDAGTVRALGALPTSYFRLLGGGAPTLHGGRAAVLRDLKERLLQELEADPTSPPGSLAERYMDWYPHAVVPVLAALSSPTPSTVEANVLTGRGIVEEGRLLLSRDHVGKLLPAPIPSPVAIWLSTFVRHELEVLSAVRSPSLATVREALRADPIVPDHVVDLAARRVWATA